MLLHCHDWSQAQPYYFNHNQLWHVQVSHHPPVGAAHAENKDWEYDMVSAPTTKFLGNSIDIYPIGQPLALSPAPSLPPAILGITSFAM